MEFRESTLHPGRQVEVGFLPNYEPREFAIHFEGFPLWLLAMERTFCSTLHILGWPTAGALKAHLELTGAPVRLAHRALAHLGLGRVIYHATLLAPRGCLVLISGGLPFLDQASLRFAEHEALFLLSRHWKGKSGCSGPAKRRLTHQAFGGPTHFVALFGSQGVKAHPLETELRRNVGHVFDYGLRPDPMSSPDTAAHAGAILLDSILHPSDLGRSVLHPTAFYASGWGIRALTMDGLVAGRWFGFVGFSYRPCANHGCLFAVRFACPQVRVSLGSGSGREIFCAAVFHLVAVPTENSSPFVDRRVHDFVQDRKA
jgi:hypothetical protein